MMKKNPGTQSSDYEIAGLVNTAFTKVPRTVIAQKGMECDSILPLIAQIFNDVDFMFLK